MQRYDIAIIGTGPAGLSAAITASLRKKRILLLGSKKTSEKVEKAHTVKNYLGLPNVSGQQLQSAFLEHLKQMELSITEDQAVTVYTMPDYFVVQGRSNELYEASSVIVAAGMSAARLFPGEMEFLGKGVSYCATCDAGLYRQKTAIVIAYSKEDEKEALFLAQIAKKVYYYPQYPQCGLRSTSDAANIEVIEGQKPLSIHQVSIDAISKAASYVCKTTSGQKITGGCKTPEELVEQLTGQTSESLSSANATSQPLMQLQTDKDTQFAHGIFILREQVVPSQLVPGLKMDGNHIAVDRTMHTNINGLFACGDITGMPYQYIKSAGEGNVAALSAVNYLSEKKSTNEI